MKSSGGQKVNVLHDRKCDFILVQAAIRLGKKITLGCKRQIVSEE
jgi:hypothetical protein